MAESTASKLTSKLPLLHVEDAVVRRAGKEILHVDSCDLSLGESVALLGPNGAGKSTFISLITREAYPLYRDIAPVVFMGNERPTLQDVKKTLGVVSATMQKQMTVHLPAVEIVAGGLFGSLGIPMRRTLSDTERERALAALDAIGIKDLADRDVMKLSSGQARRVLIARALVHHPKVLVLDEPCVGLDPEGMYYLRRTMRDLVAQGITLVLVTHYPEDIIPEIQRVILIKDGGVYADGPKKDLLCDQVLSDLFNFPLEVREEDGYYSYIARY